MIPIDYLIIAMSILTLAIPIYIRFFYKRSKHKIALILAFFMGMSVLVLIGSINFRFKYNKYIKELEERIEKGKNKNTKPKYFIV